MGIEERWICLHYYRRTRPGPIILQIEKSRTRIYNHFTVDLTFFRMDFCNNALDDIKQIFLEYIEERKRKRSGFFCAMSKSFISSPYLREPVFSKVLWQVLNILYDPFSYCSIGYEKIPSRKDGEQSKGSDDNLGDWEAE